MKIACCLCSILALMLVSYSIAQNEPDVKHPQTLEKLFHVGDLIGFDGNPDLSTFALTLYSDQESKMAMEYYANPMKKTYLEIERELELTKDPEKRRQLRESRSKITRRDYGNPGKIFAIGSDYIGLTRIDNGSDLYIPFSKIGSVTRNRGIMAKDVPK